MCKVPVEEVCWAHSGDKQQGTCMTGPCGRKSLDLGVDLGFPLSGWKDTAGFEQGLSSSGYCVEGLIQLLCMGQWGS